MDGARTPEELETLLEDALLLGSRDALLDLFEDAALLDLGDGCPAFGAEDIARCALAQWTGADTYVADPRHVIQVRDVALVINELGVNVAHRGGDGTWRFAIVHRPIIDDRTTGKETERDMVEKTTQALQPAVVRADEGEARWWFDGLAVFKATAAMTGGQLSIVEVTEPPGAATPLHVHYREDESFWILDGSATFYVGEATIEASVGDFVFGPRDIPHRYTVGNDGCRMLFIVNPGGFEQLVTEMSEPAQTRTLPPPSEAMPDFERVAAIAKANGCELLA